MFLTCKLIKRKDSHIFSFISCIERGGIHIQQNFLLKNPHGFAPTPVIISHQSNHCKLTELPIHSANPNIISA